MSIYQETGQSRFSTPDDFSANGNHEPSTPTPVQVERQIQNGTPDEIDDVTASIMHTTGIQNTDFIAAHFLRKRVRKPRTGRLNNFLVGLFELTEDGYDPDDVASVICDNPKLITRKGKLNTRRIREDIDNLPIVVPNGKFSFEP